MTCTATPFQVNDARRMKAFEINSKKEKENVLCELQDAQSIKGSNIDSVKLAELLRMKFGVGAYNIHVSERRD